MFKFPHVTFKHIIRDDLYLVFSKNQLMRTLKENKNGLSHCHLH